MELTRIQILLAFSVDQGSDLSSILTLNKAQLTLDLLAHRQDVKAIFGNI